jgi:hypothetical protein
MLKQGKWSSNTTVTINDVEVLINIEIANSTMVQFQAKNSVQAGSNKHTLYNRE